MKKYLPVLALAALAFVPLSKGEQISPVKSAAIHECSVSAAEYAEYVWGDVEIYKYRTCMFNYGKPE